MRRIAVSIAQHPARSLALAAAFIAFALVVRAGVGTLLEDTAGADEPARGVAGPALHSEAAAAYAPEGVITFTRDGERFAVSPAEPARAITPAPAPAASEREPGHYPSPDGARVATVRRDETGVTLDVREGDEIVFSLGLAGPSDPELRGVKAQAAAVEGIPLAVAWSPDSRHLAAGSITGAPWALSVIDTRFWTVERHEVFGGYVGELAWSPDGQLLAISTYEVGLTDHTVLLFNPLDRTIQQLIRGCTIVWAPDGQYLAVRREPRDVPGLWVVAIDGSAMARLAEGSASFPVSWTDDASHVAAAP